MNRSTQMIGIFVGILLVLVVVVFANTVGASPAGSPLYSDPTPTPMWFSHEVGESTATHDGDAGITEGNTVEMPADDVVGAVIFKLEKLCPGGANSHWAKARYDGDGGGWDANVTSSIQACGSVVWRWYFQPNQSYVVDDIDDMVWADFPALDSLPPFSTVMNLTSTATDYQAYTDAGGPGDAGYQSKLEIYYLTYDQYECVSTAPEDREALSTGLLHGDDETGEVFQLVPGQEYQLYTNAGPWNDGTDDRYDIAVRFRTSHTEDPPSGEWGEWAELSTINGLEECDTSYLDANGVSLIFEANGTAPDTQSQIQFRVNDEEDEFEDNSGDIEYYWLGGEGTGQGCGANWTLGTKVAGHTLPGDQAYIYDLSQYYSGGSYAGKVGPGESYGYVVTGSYLDDGSESTETIVKVNADGTPWTDPNDAFLAYKDQCEDDETDGVITYWGTTVNAWGNDISAVIGSRPYGQIEDGDANYTNNSGSIAVEWYEANWTAPPSDCSINYNIGTFIESPVFFAKNEDGVEYPQHTNGLVIGQVYYLESQGVPYSLNGSPSYDFEARWVDLLNPVDWEDPEVFADCITEIDQERSGYYFVAEQETFELRAEHTIYGHDVNTGSLKFNLYGAIPYAVPPGEDCGDYFTLGTVAWRGSVDADSTAGYSVDYSVFDAGEEYAIAVVPGAYTDPNGTGKTGEIRRSAPGMGSVYYESMDEWSGALCYEDDNATIGVGYEVVYFEAGALSDYEVRATEPTGGNTGTFNFQVYNIVRLQEPVLGCEHNYSDVDAWYVVKQDEIVSANNPGVEYDDEDNIIAVPGYVLANAFTEENLVYKLETGFPGDIQTMPPYYVLQVSTDGGATWIYLEDWAECYVDLIVPEGRVYWTAPLSGGPFILRVYDNDENWRPNVGGVSIDMWVSSASVDPGDIWDDPRYWGEGCYAICSRPGWLQIGEWIEYARCRITRWFAWCPSHADDLIEIQEAFYSVQPFRTIFELIELGSAIKDEVNSYTWTEDAGGGDATAEFEAPRNFILLPGEGGGGAIPLVGEDSIWGSGEIDLNPDDAYIFSTECDNELADAVGTRMASSMCFAFNVVDQLGLKTWFQIFWDFGVAGVFVLYIKKNWVDPLNA